MSTETREMSLTPYVSRLGAWAFAVGVSIGWGSLVVTANTYLIKSGPWGSVLGMLMGTIVMLVISKNYHYLTNAMPSAGGAYTFVRETFGYDHGFLTAWFLSITYIAVFWANVTSLPLFARYFVGNVFQFGFHYSIFGYDVYLGEALLSIVAIIVFALICMNTRKGAMGLMIAFVIAFTVGITVCFAGAMLGIGDAARAFDPGFTPDNNAMMQIVQIACISPWAFIGFEAITNSSAEFAFPHKQTFSILAIAVITTAALYIFILLLSVTAYPPGYDNWFEYIQDLNNLSGLEGLPAFYAAHHYLGGMGVNILMVALFSLIASSLIGNITSISRLFFALAEDAVIPLRFAKISNRHIPKAAITLIVAFSVFMPFLGRTAIGWIVDVTNIGAVIVYGFVSASAYRLATQKGDKVERATGVAGLALMLGFGLFLVLPNLMSTGSMEKETYLLLTVWGVFGFLFFRNILARDRMRRFGKSIIVWIALLALVLFVSFLWMDQYIMTAAHDTAQNIYEYAIGAGSALEANADADAFVTMQLTMLAQSETVATLIVVAIAAFTLSILLSNFSYVNKRARENEEQLKFTRDIANNDQLTGVKSQYAYTEWEQAMNERIADGSEEDFAVVVCDVNDLKLINDEQGHHAGDAYIKSASSLICNLFSHSPVFRIGGDEFVVILTGRDYASRHELMENLHAQIEENAARGDVVVASGMSDYLKGTDFKLRSVFVRADARMYDDKRRLKGTN